MVHADRPEKGDSRSEAVDIEAGADATPHVLDTVSQGVGELEVERRSGLLHVVARDRDRVEAGHAIRGVVDDVGDDPHRRLGRVDIGVADHELFEDVVLDRPGELVRLHPLLLGGDDVERHHRQYRPIHGHRDADVTKRDAVKQHPHVEDRVHRHACHANIAPYARVVGVVAAMRGEVEGDRQALLPGGEVAAVESVGILGGREAGVLADGPRPVGVHRGVGATNVRRNTGQAAEMVDVLDVCRTVGVSDVDTLR
jgi:hypothetical protein